MTKPNQPTAPRKPEPHECCGTGCIPCVMDIYEEELWQYEKDLKAWEAASKTENTDSAP
jgi:Oxidoreductase-like protein, N-terminal